MVVPGPKVNFKQSGEVTAATGDCCIDSQGAQDFDCRINPLPQRRAVRCPQEHPLIPPQFLHT
jgi:hypothetical protein